MRYLENYLERIKRKGNLTLADAISKTVSDVVPQYISNFSFREHVVSLLVGDVQSGKTSSYVWTYVLQRLRGICEFYFAYNR